MKLNFNVFKAVSLSVLLSLCNASPSTGALTGRILKNDKLVGLMEKADKFLSDGDYLEAEQAYINIIKIAPNNPAGHLGLGRYYFLEGSYDKAVKQLREAVKLAPNSADVHFELGSTYLYLRMTDQAIKHLEIARNISPERPELGYKLSQAKAFKDAVLHHTGMSIDRRSEFGVVFRLAASGRVQEAIHQAMKALDIYPDSASLHYQIGILSKAMNDIEGARLEFEKTLKLNPDYFMALDQITHIYLSEDKFASADEYLTHWIEIDPDNPTAHFNKYLLDVYQKKYESAEPNIKTAVRLDPRNAQLLNHYGLLLRELGHDAKAAVYFQRALSVKPKEDAPRLNLAMIYLADSKPQMADEVLDPLRKLNYTSADFLAVSSLVNAKLGKWDKAVAAGENAFKEMQSNEVAIVAKALILTHEGKGEQAIDLLESFHSENPEKLFVVQELSEVYSKQGKLQEAVAMAREAKKLNPDSLATDNLLMFNLARQKKFKEALQVLAESKNIDERDKPMTEGKVYEMAQNMSKAIGHYKSLVKKNPYNEDANLRLGQIYFGRNDMKNAAKYLFKVIDQNETNTEARIMYIKVLLERGKKKQALVECKQILKYAPHDQEVQSLIGRTQYAMRHYEEAAEAFGTYEDISKLDSQALYAYGNTLKKLKRYDEAKKVIDSARSSRTLTDKMLSRFNKLAKGL